MRETAAAVANHTWSAIHPGLALTLSIGLCADTTLPGHERMLAMADRNLYCGEGGRTQSGGQLGSGWRRDGGA